MLAEEKTALIKRQTVEDVVGQRNLAIAQFKVGLDALARADEAWKRSANQSYGSYDFGVRNSSVEGFTRKLDGEVWQHLLKLTTLRDLMDVEARKKFDQQCDREPPPVTVDNVLATLQSLMASAGDIFHRSIIATFEALPRNFRSNDGFKLGKRIILEYAISVSGTREHQWYSFYGHNYAAERMHDLDRIFHVMDGKDPPSYMGGAVGLCSEAVRVQKPPFKISTPYFYVEGFKKGTVHIWPHRRDLIDKANRILADHYGWALPDGRTAA